MHCLTPSSSCLTSCNGPAFRRPNLTGCSYPSMACGCRHNALRGCFQLTRAQHFGHKVVIKLCSNGLCSLSVRPEISVRPKCSHVLCHARSFACLQVSHKPYRPSGMTVKCQRNQQAVASDNAAVSTETYSEESHDDIKSSHDTPPKTKQATFLETWLQVSTRH